MIKGFTRPLLGAICVAVLSVFARADAPVKFEEVFGLVRSNLTGVSEADLSKAAALGLIEKLGGKVELAEPTSKASNTPVVAKTNLFDTTFAYVRLNRVAPGVRDQMTDAIRSFRKLKGVVLDLRFARGDDYNAAIEAANVFIDAEQTLLKWGDQTGKTKANPEAVKLPVVLLVNRQTAGAAEALAGALRISQGALLVGNRTAGQAVEWAGFPLSSGQELKIARSNVELGDGKAITSEGLAPDLVVEADERNERSWLDDPYRVITKPGSPAGPQPFLTSVTNRFLRRPNAAEIGRRFREELNSEETPENSGGRAAAAQEEKIVQDAALVRALDILKGITATRFKPTGN
ncbi:MAG TPA: S41 family peptidase [Verrucomicrobiae bacterium]|nr:S41 family peptidase [Verrucomicrobiae bacterium]